MKNKQTELVRTGYHLTPQEKNKIRCQIEIEYYWYIREHSNYSSITDIMFSTDMDLKMSKEMMNEEFYKTYNKYYQYGNMNYHYIMYALYGFVYTEQGWMDMNPNKKDN